MGLQTTRKQFEDFANFNYGATGLSIGFSEVRLLREAGRANIGGGNSRPEWGTPGLILNPWGGTPPYGDDPKDAEMIKRGFGYYKAGCHTRKR